MFLVTRNILSESFIQRTQTISFFNTGDAFDMVDSRSELGKWPGYPRVSPMAKLDG